MSTAGLLSRLGFRQGLRTLTSTNARKCVPLLSSRGLRETAAGSRSLQRLSPIANQALLQPRRLYSSDNFLKSKGDMKIAVIGQSMFGQEVLAWGSQQAYWKHIQSTWPAKVWPKMAKLISLIWRLEEDPLMWFSATIATYSQSLLAPSHTCSVVLWRLNEGYNRLCCNGRYGCVYSGCPYNLDNSGIPNSNRIPCCPNEILCSAHNNKIVQHDPLV